MREHTIELRGLLAFLVAESFPGFSPPEASLPFFHSNVILMGQWAPHLEIKRGDIPWKELCR